MRRNSSAVPKKGHYSSVEGIWFETCPLPQTRALEIPV